MARDLIDELLHGRVKATLFGGDHAPRIGRLVILEPIGAGAMGTVFAAYDPRLDRRVAVKLVRGGGDDANQRVLAEARALGRLTHPNVVAVHDADEVDGSIYIVMELAPGASLRAWAEADPTWRDVVGVMRQAALGLAAAHDAGIVHRDVKPDNILIGPDRVRLVDFGLAARSDDDDRAATASAGTPSYMAPEVLAGDTATAASDQFSFGVTLYEALYGERPYRALRREDLLAAARTAANAARPAGTDVPSWLHAIAIHALAAAPEARFPSMAAIATELGHDRKRRRRIAAASAAVMAALAVTGAVAYRGGAAGAHDDPCRGGPSRRQAAVSDARLAQVRTALGDAAWAKKAAADLGAAAGGWESAFRTVCEATRKAGAQSDALYTLRMRCLDRRLDRIAALADALVPAPNAALDADARDDATTAIASLPASDTCVTVVDPGELALPVDTRARDRVVAAERDLDRAWSSYVLDRYADAQTQIEAIDAATADLDAPCDGASDAGRPCAPGLRAQVLLLAGSIEARIGKPGPARDKLQAAIAAAAAAHADDVESDGWLRLLRWALFSDSPDRVIEWAPFARAAAARAGSPSALIDGIVAEALRKRRDLAGARDLLTRALASADGLRGDQRGLLEMNLGSVELLAGHPAAADAAFARGLDAATATLGADHPGLGIYFDKRAVAARERGDLAAALAGHDGALALRTVAFGDRDRTVATSRLYRAQTLIEAGRIADAEADLAIARSIRTPESSSAHDVAEVDSAAGDAALAGGRRSDALALYTSAAARFAQLDFTARMVRAGAPVAKTDLLATAAATGIPTLERIAAIAERVARTAPAAAHADAAALATALPCTDDLAPAFLVELGNVQRAAGERVEAARCYQTAATALGDTPSRQSILANAGLADTTDDAATRTAAATRALTALAALPELDQAARAHLTKLAAGAR